MKLAAILLVFIATTAQATATRAWQHSRVYLPGSWFATTIDRAQAPPGTPIVIYLHGCAGITESHDHHWGQWLSRNGYAVIMPDSMSRQGRRSVCDSRTHRLDRSLFPRVYEYRDQEITESLQRAQQLPWADPNRIYLMGHSEGAFAVSQHQALGYRAAIISAWTCRPVRGLPPIRTVPPTLNLVFDRDPWFPGDTNTCRFWLSSVEEQRLPGPGHATAHHPEMRQAVLEFLRQHR